MSQYWDSVAARADGLHTAEDFEATAYRLVAEQVLYYSDRHSRAAYWMVERFERDFKQALSIIGVNVDVNRRQRYVCAIPRTVKAGSASVSQTVLALVLRSIYDESAQIGQLNDDGEVVCELIELEEKYRLMTKREFPGKGELDSLLRTMRRWGIAKKADEAGNETGVTPDDVQPYVVVIRPAIIDILGEAALQKLSQWQAVNPTSITEDEEAADSLESDEGGAKSS